MTKLITTFPDSPRLIKGSFELIDPETSAVQRRCSQLFVLKGKRP